MMMFDYGESPIKTIAPDGDGYMVYVGSGSGDLACFDMRTGKYLEHSFAGTCNQYKEFGFFM